MKLKKTFPFITFDKTANAGAIYLREGEVADTKEVILKGAFILIDVDKSGVALSIEVVKIVTP